MNHLAADWQEALSDQFSEEYYQKLWAFVEKEYDTETVFPPKEEIFTAFRLTPLKEVRVVILGQDPYHNEGQAHGLSFSVREGVPLPPSLENIFRELEEDCGCRRPKSGCLEEWAKGGVLLLNTVLTVRAHEANSHKGQGWEIFTDAVLKCLNEEERPMVFFLWGKPAQAKAKFLTNPRHLVLTAPHPSPLSSYRGFFGCKHFSKANEFLLEKGAKPIDWQLPVL